MTSISQPREFYSDNRRTLFDRAVATSSGNAGSYEQYIPSEPAVYNPLADEGEAMELVNTKVTFTPTSESDNLKTLTVYYRRIPLSVFMDQAGVKVSAVAGATMGVLLNAINAAYGTNLRAIEVENTGTFEEGGKLYMNVVATPQNVFFTGNYKLLLNEFHRPVGPLLPSDTDYFFSQSHATLPRAQVACMYSDLSSSHIFEFASNAASVASSRIDHIVDVDGGEMILLGSFRMHIPGITSTETTFNSLQMDKRGKILSISAETLFEFSANTELTFDPWRKRIYSRNRTTKVLKAFTMTGLEISSFSLPFTTDAIAVSAHAIYSASPVITSGSTQTFIVTRHTPQGVQMPSFAPVVFGRPTPASPFGALDLVVHYDTGIDTGVLVRYLKDNVPVLVNGTPNSPLTAASDVLDMPLTLLDLTGTKRNNFRTLYASFAANVMDPVNSFGTLKTIFSGDDCFLMAVWNNRNYTGRNILSFAKIDSRGDITQQAISRSGTQPDVTQVHSISCAPDFPMHDKGYVVAAEWNEYQQDGTVRSIQGLLLFTSEGDYAGSKPITVDEVDARFGRTAISY